MTAMSKASTSSGKRPDNGKPKRKRRRKARTEDFSSSSSSSDSDSDSDDKSKEKEAAGEETSQDDDEEKAVGESEDERYDTSDDEQKINNEKIIPNHQGAHKLDSRPPPVFPDSLTNLDDPTANKRFANYISDLQLKEFSTDLDTLRNAKDFNEKSLQSLVGILNQGDSLFSRQEKEIILKSDFDSQDTS